MDYNLGGRNRVASYIYEVNPLYFAEILGHGSCLVGVTRIQKYGSLWDCWRSWEKFLTEVWKDQRTPEKEIRKANAFNAA